MRLAVMLTEGERVPVIRTGEEEAVPLRGIDPAVGRPGAVLAALADPAGRDRLRSALEVASEGFAITADTRWSRPTFSEQQRGHGAILGIGLNYRRHAEDLGAPLPTEPAFFTKDARTAVSCGETILLPPESQRVTAEAELALVVGRTCWRVPPDEALAHVAGACAVLDQTAEDVLHRNTRFLTRAKSWPSFIVLGTDVVSLDELLDEQDLPDVRVTTCHNGSEHRSAPVADMLFDPAAIVSFLSGVMPLEPGDIVCTGTPGAAVVDDGDAVGGRVSGVGTVHAAVRRPGPDDYRGEVLAQLGREGRATGART